MNIKDPQAQATPRQLWFLHRLTGEDTRELKLTRLEASEKIEALTKAKETKKTPAGKPATAKKPETKARVNSQSSTEPKGKLDGELEAFRFLGRVISEHTALEAINEIWNEFHRCDNELMARSAPFGGGLKTTHAKADGWTTEELSTYTMKLATAFSNIGGEMDKMIEQTEELASFQGSILGGMGDKGTRL